MRIGRQSSGYTIVEVLIVLAVSSALLVAALLLVNGQQQKTAFFQSIHDIQNQINSVINNVSTGYYHNTNNFTCTAGVADIEPQISAGTNSQGQNQGCIFIGRAMQFGVHGTSGAGYNIYNLVGLQNKTGTSSDVTSLSEAAPLALAPGSTGLGHDTVPSATEVDSLGYGLAAYKMRYNGNSANAIGTVAFVTDFAQNGGSGGLTPGSRTAQLYAVNTSVLNSTAAVAVDSMDKNTGCGLNKACNYTLVTSVDICFQSGGTNQYGIITIGSHGRDLTTTLQITNQAPTPPECV